MTNLNLLFLLWRKSSLIKGLIDALKETLNVYHSEEDRVRKDALEFRFSRAECLVLMEKDDVGITLLLNLFGVAGCRL